MAAARIAERACSCSLTMLKSDPTLSLRINGFNVRPWPTSVVAMTKKVRKMITLRAGKGSPLGRTVGIASAAASETMPASRTN